MKSAVIDANVIIKWIFPERTDEDHQSQAIYLLHAIKKGSVKIFQPAHWLAEVTAVVVRLRPSIAKDTVDLLYALEFPVLNEPEIYQLACKLSEQFNHHLFDTLYHATALYGGYTFITADDKYFAKHLKWVVFFNWQIFYPYNYYFATTKSMMSREGLKLWTAF